MALLDVQRAAVALFSRRGFEATGHSRTRRGGRVELGNSVSLRGRQAGGAGRNHAPVLGRLLACGRAAPASSTDPVEQLAALIDAHVGICALNPRTALVTDQEMRGLAAERRTALTGLRDDYETLFAAVLTRGAKRRMFRLVDAGLTRLALLEMCNGVARWYRPGGRLSVEDVQRCFVELGARLVGVDSSEPWTGPLAAARMVDVEPRVAVSS